MKIIRESKRGTCDSYCRNFGITDNSGKLSVRYGFPCDISGKVFPVKECAMENLTNCFNGMDSEGNRIHYMGIETISQSYWDPAIGECERCGEHLLLAKFTNTCTCGADYNQSGDLLTDREYWGEETGERASDIVSCNYDLD